MEKEFKVYRISYNASEDSFDTYSYVGNKEYPDWDDFNFTSRFPEKKGILNEDKNISSDEKEFVHIDLIRQIEFCIDLGYRIEFENR